MLKKEEQVVYPADFRNRNKADLVKLFEMTIKIYDFYYELSTNSISNFLSSEEKNPVNINVLPESPVSLDYIQNLSQELLNSSDHEIEHDAYPLNPDKKSLSEKKVTNDGSFPELDLEDYRNNWLSNLSDAESLPKLDDKSQGENDDITNLHNPMDFINKINELYLDLQVVVKNLIRFIKENEKDLKIKLITNHDVNLFFVKECLKKQIDLWKIQFLSCCFFNLCPQKVRPETFYFTTEYRYFILALLASIDENAKNRQLFSFDDDLIFAEFSQHFLLLFDDNSSLNMTDEDYMQMTINPISFFHELSTIAAVKYEIHNWLKEFKNKFNLGYNRTKTALTGPFLISLMLGNIKDNIANELFSSPAYLELCCREINISLLDFIKAALHDQKLRKYLNVKTLIEHFNIEISSVEDIFTVHSSLNEQIRLNPQYFEQLSNDLINKLKQMPLRVHNIKKVIDPKVTPYFKKNPNGQLTATFNIDAQSFLGFYFNYWNASLLPLHLLSVVKKVLLHRRKSNPSLLTKIELNEFNEIDDNYLLFKKDLFVLKNKKFEKINPKFLLEEELNILNTSIDGSSVASLDALKIIEKYNKHFLYAANIELCRMFIDDKIYMFIRSINDIQPNERLLLAENKHNFSFKNLELHESQKIDLVEIELDGFFKKEPISPTVIKPQVPKRKNRLQEGTLDFKLLNTPKKSRREYALGTSSIQIPNDFFSIFKLVKNKAITSDNLTSKFPNLDKKKIHAIFNTFMRTDVTEKVINQFLSSSKSIQFRDNIEEFYFNYYELDDEEIKKENHQDQQTVDPNVFFVKRPYSPARKEAKTARNKKQKLNV